MWLFYIRMQENEIISLFVINLGIIKKEEIDVVKENLGYYFRGEMKFG